MGVEATLIYAAIEYSKKRFGPEFSVANIRLTLTSVDGSVNTSLCPALWYLGQTAGGAAEPVPGKQVSRRVPLRERILLVLAGAERPLKAALIARKAGHKLDAHLRETLSQLCKGDSPKVFHDGRSGYWLTERPLPSKESSGTDDGTKAVDDFAAGV